MKYTFRFLLNTIDFKDSPKKKKKGTGIGVAKLCNEGEGGLVGIEVGLDDPSMGSACGHEQHREGAQHTDEHRPGTAT